MKITVYNDWDHLPKAEGEGEQQVILSWDGEYRKGDVIAFTDLLPDRFYMVQVDACVPEALVLIRSDEVLYPVPFYEKKTSYNPLAFFGNRHYLSIRLAESFEIQAFRNLAKNPFDQHDVSHVYPHASANVETRGEAVFQARNAIDGVIATQCHGEWPYESWGINRQEDAAFTLNFGRPVDISEVRLYTRADFPHDNWWTDAELSFSDGTATHLTMQKKAGLAHCFPIIRKGITSLCLHDLIKSGEPSPFPALTQIEVYGTEHKK